MTEMERTKLNAMRLDGLSQKEIATRLGLSINTVKVYCHRNPLSSTAVADHKGVCRFCGKPLQRLEHKRPRRYCSDKCRMAWWKKNEAQLNRKAFYRIVCQHCGTAFDSYGNPKRKYCSRGCYALARKKVDRNG